MILNKLPTAAVLAMLLALSGCSSTDDEDEATKVAELTEIQAKFTPEVIWDQTVGDGVDDYFSRLKPAVGYSKVYVADREGILAAYSIENGDRIWQTDLSDLDNQRSFWQSTVSAQLAGGPTVAQKMVFVGSENGQLFALDAETGSLKWQAKVGGEIIAAPAVDENVAVVATSSGILQAFNASTGEQLWKAEREVPPLTLRGISAPAITSGGVLVGNSNGNVSVYILKTGQQGWSTAVGEATGSTELERVIDVDSKPLIYGDKVYAISVRGNLMALDLRSGSTVWKRQYSSYHSLAIDGNTLYLTNTKGHVFAVDRNNGVELWSQLALTNRGVTGPVVLGNYVVVGDYEGYLHWLDNQTGEIVARYQVDSSGFFATPVTNGEQLITQTRDGEVSVLTIPN